MKNILLVSTLLVLFTHCSEGPVPGQDPVEQKINDFLSQMTLTEKIGQTSQRGTSSRVKGQLPEALKQAVREGRIGSVLNVMDKSHVDELQKIAVEESPHGIPLIFARDVIHGFKTIFPIPLGQAATWNPEIVERGARVAAIEASTYGIRWTFAPMLDIARDPRWGRIAESPGEDPYLASVLSGAYVRGFQGDDLTDPTSMIACAKHFAGYGAAEGGRDYNTAVINEALLRNVYLPPFKMAVDAGVQTFMSGFNEMNGIPVSGSPFLLDQVLRQEWAFDGFVVSDWNSITEMIDHGFAADEKAAGLAASVAGVDMEMTSRSYENHLRTLIKSGELPMAKLDNMVRAILRVKFRMGLFDQPFRKEDEGVILSESHKQTAKESALQSLVLLKNNGILPLSSNQSILITGPLSHAPLDQMGTWTFDGDQADVITPLMALKSTLSAQNLSYINALEFSRDKRRTKFDEAIRAAAKSDVILFFGGEEAILSGEAHSRAHLNLPGAQEALIKALKEQTGKPIILIIQAGRPIVLENILDELDAVLMAWHPGTMGGPAIVDVLTGKYNPTGRLPVSWPKSVGQIPIYYNHKNTGRPVDPDAYVAIDDIPVGAWQSSLGNDSHYLDDGFAPMFPFGFGLSNSSFAYYKLSLSTDSIKAGEVLKVQIEVENESTNAGTAVAQLYVQDVFASLTRPVKELKAFKQIELSAGERKSVAFELNSDDLVFYNNQGERQLESGKFTVFVGANAQTQISKDFWLIR